MKKTKIKAIAAALLVSMSVSALAIPSYAKTIGDGLTIPEDGVVTYDFNTNENPFEEHRTGGTVETANGTPNTVLEIGGIQNYVFQIGKGERNIYTPKNWETDYTKKSMSVRINNSGLRHTGNMSFQRIILWYENETNWLGLDWKISDTPEATRADYTYDTKIVAMKSGLANSASATSETVLEKWEDLKYNGKKMLVGDKADWLRLDVTYAAKDKIELSLYKENNPDEKYVNANITTKSFDAYDIKNATKVSDSSTYFADNDLRKGLFGIAGVNYDNNVGYYDDLTVTLDTDSAKILKFKTDNADALALDADGFYEQFKTDYSAYTANLVKVKAAYTEFSALADSIKAQLTSEKSLLNDLLFVEKKALAYLGNDIYIDFEDGLSVDKHIALITEYGNSGGRTELSVVTNPLKTGNTSEKVVQLAIDGWTGSSNMIHKIRLTDVNSSNYIDTVSFKMYYGSHKNSGSGTRFYLNYTEDKDISKTDYLSFFSDGPDQNMQFYVDKYNSEKSAYDRRWGSQISGDKSALELMQNQWYTVNIKYTAAGVAITIVNSAGNSTDTFNVDINNPENSKIFAIGMPQIANGYFDDFKVTFRSPYTMAMTNGAWLRNDATPGIRFGAQNIAANELYGASDCTVVAAGALFMPYDKLEDGEQLTIERASVRNANGAKALKAESATNVMPANIYGVLANVIENDKIDKSRDFVCRTYIKYTKAGDPTGTYRYAYADADNENMKRSLSRVVLAAAKDLAEYDGDIYDDAIAALKNKGYLGGNK